MIDIHRLQEGAARYGIALDGPTLAAFAQYADVLVEYNQKTNLTAITSPEAMESKHFIDSLLLAAQPEINQNLLDVGSGAGFPGMVAKLYRPELSVALMESNGKKVAFLQHLASCLGVEAELIKRRAEEAARDQWRERYATVTARGVAALPALCEYCLPLVKPGGWFIAMKGPNLAERESALRAIDLLGGELRDTRRYLLPDGSQRNLIFVYKAKPTPSQYPRAGAKIAKAPL